MKNNDKLLKQAEKVLKENGWEVIVIGGIAVEQREAKYNFKLTINFTGKKD